MGRVDRSKRRLLVYIGAVVAASVTLTWFSIEAWGLPSLVELAFFWCVLALGDRLEIAGTVRGIPQAGIRPRAPTLSAGFLVVMACAFATDPATTAILGMTGALVPSGWRGIERTVFNGAQTATYGGLASLGFSSVRHELGVGPLATIVAAAIAVATATALNTSLVGGALALERHRRLNAVLKELGWSLPNSVAFSLLPLLVGVLYRNASSRVGGVSAVLFILAPLFVLRQTRQGKLELEAARIGALQAFVGAVDLKSPWTSQHSSNVAAIAVALHRELGATEEELEKRYYGALLHDVGKVAVSGRVLSKNGPLEDDEWEEMRRHPGAGALVLSDVEFLRDLVPEVLYHHERLDGSGYPSGLRGEEIPFEARVLAVADSFEALTSDRPYRRALSRKEALEVLGRCAGHQLDPLAVDALAKLVDVGYELPTAVVRTLPPKEAESAHIAARGA